MTWPVRHALAFAPPRPVATEDEPPPPRRDNLHATVQATGMAIKPHRFGRDKVACIPEERLPMVTAAGRDRRARSAVMRGASVTGHARWSHTELSVLSGYRGEGGRLRRAWDRRDRHRVGPRLARVRAAKRPARPKLPPRTGPARPSPPPGATRRARRARWRAQPPGPACRRGLAMKPMPAVTGRTVSTRSYSCARSAVGVGGGGPDAGRQPDLEDLPPVGLGHGGHGQRPPADPRPGPLRVQAGMHVPQQPADEIPADPGGGLGCRLWRVASGLRSGRKAVRAIWWRQLAHWGRDRRRSCG